MPQFFGTVNTLCFEGCPWLLSLWRARHRSACRWGHCIRRALTYPDHGGSHLRCRHLTETEEKMSWVFVIKPGPRTMLAQAMDLRSCLTGCQRPSSTGKTGIPIHHHAKRVARQHVHERIDPQLRLPQLSSALQHPDTCFCFGTRVHTSTISSGKGMLQRVRPFQHPSLLARPGG